MKPGMQLLRTRHRTEMLFSSLEMQHRAIWSELLPFLITHHEQPHKRHRDLAPTTQSHSNLLNARSGTPLTGIFRLYSIKGEKKKAAQFNNCRSVYSLPEPPRIRDFYLPLRSLDSLPPLYITGWIITAWNLPCHFPAPWRNSPCPHPSDNAHCEQECQSRDGQRSPSSHHGPEWPCTTVNSALTSG